MDIHAVDWHPDHLLKGTRDFGLHGSPDLPDVAVATEYEVEIDAGPSALDGDPNPISQSAAEPSVYSPRHRRKAGDTGYGERRLPSDGNEYRGSDRRPVGVLFAYPFRGRRQNIPIPPSTVRTWPVM